MCLCNVNIQVLVNELWDKILKSSARKLSKCVPDNVQVYIERKKILLHKLAFMTYLGTLYNREIAHIWHSFKIKVWFAYHSVIYYSDSQSLSCILSAFLPSYDVNNRIVLPGEYKRQFVKIVVAGVQTCQLNHLAVLTNING